MVSCSSRDAQCPPGFVEQFVLSMLLFGIVWALLGWFLARQIERNLRAGNVTERFVLFSFWPLFGPLPLWNLRLFFQLRWVIGTFLVFIPTLIAVASVRAGGPPELRYLGIGFPIFFVAAVAYWIWAISAAVRRAGGLPPRPPN